MKVEEQEDGEREETPEEGGREEGVKRGRGRGEGYAVILSTDFHCRELMMNEEAS